MPNKPTYINLPIYSVPKFITTQQHRQQHTTNISTSLAVVVVKPAQKTKSYIFIIIIHQQFIYKHKILPNTQPIARIQTGDKIIQNMYICSQRKILIASINQYVKIFEILNNGVELNEIVRFRADYSQKNSTIYSLCFSTKLNVLCTAGEDLTVRYFYLDNKTYQPIHQKHFQHNHHSNPLKNVDYNEKNLFLSCDTNQIVIVDIETKKCIRKVYNDQLQPEKSMFLSAYFKNPDDSQIIISHYILRKAAYVTQETGNKFQTAQITKDQSCLTSYNRQLKLLGVACGNGSTYLVRATNLKVIGKQHNHGFVITGGTISRGGRFVTGNFLSIKISGTPQCSFNVQQVDQPIFGCSMIPLVALVITLLVIFLCGSVLTASDVSLSDL